MSTFIYNSKKPGILSSFADSASTFSLAQLTQAAKKGKMCYYDFGDPVRNRIVYGQSTAPVYNITKITEGSMSIFSGNTDILASYDSILEMIRDLRGGVKVESNYINRTGLYFNHASFIMHKNVSRYLIQPSLIHLES